MEIKILGPGCARCDQLKKTTRQVVEELGIDASIEEVKDVKRIMDYPILTTPGLVVDGELVCSGKVPDKAEVTRLIVNALASEESGK